MAHYQHSAHRSPPGPPPVDDAVAKAAVLRRKIANTDVLEPRADYIIEVLSSAGIHSLHDLAAQDHPQWQQISTQFAQMRVDHFSLDALDVRMLGPGHLNSMGRIWQEARSDAEHRRSARRVHRAVAMAHDVRNRVGRGLMAIPEASEDEDDA